MEWIGTNSTRLEIIRKNPFFGNNTASHETRIFTLSNQVNKHIRFFTTKRVKQDETKNFKLNPWFITGFIDAEGCFMLNLVKNNKLKAGWRVQPWFKIGLHKKDLHILESIKNYFGVGKIYDQGPEAIQYLVGSIEDLTVIVNHLNKYPLITKKSSDFLLFKLGLEIIKSKSHLIQEGLEKLISIKASLNLGLSKQLETAFPNVIPMTKVFNDHKISDPNWLAGFMSGESCFHIKIYPSKTKLGEAVMLLFQVVQRSRDESLMRSISAYLDCGRITVLNDAVHLHVTKFSDLIEKVIPFFREYTILGIKSQDFKDFCLSAEIMKEKRHLTIEGLNEIREI